MKNMILCLAVCVYGQLYSAAPRTSWSQKIGQPFRSGWNAVKSAGRSIGYAASPKKFSKAIKKEGYEHMDDDALIKIIKENTTWKDRLFRTTKSQQKIKEKLPIQHTELTDDYLNQPIATDSKMHQKKVNDYDDPDIESIQEHSRPRMQIARKYDEKPALVNDEYHSKTITYKDGRIRQEYKFGSTAGDKPDYAIITDANGNETRENLSRAAKSREKLKEGLKEIEYKEKLQREEIQNSLD